MKMINHLIVNTGTMPNRNRRKAGSICPGRSITHGMLFAE